MSSDAMSTVKMPAWSPRPAANAAVSAERQAAAAQQAAAEVPAPPFTAATVKDAAQAIESYMKSTNRQLEFRVDETSGQMVVSVRDAATGDLIRQIPGEAALRMARQLKEAGVSEDAVSLVNLKV